MEYLAHLDQKTGKKQYLRCHCHNVAALCAEFGEKAGLKNTAKLIGLLHDSGKATRIFMEYLFKDDISLRGTVNHAACGARYVYDRLKQDGGVNELTAQIVALTICSHHSGLADCVNIEGEDIFNKRIFPEKDIHFEEAVANFLKECISTDALGEIYRDSMKEIASMFADLRQMCNSVPEKNDKAAIMNFCLGLVVRLLLSCLLDADRFDTFLMMTGIKAPPPFDLPKLWKSLSERLERHLGSLPDTGIINRLRKQISVNCLNFSEYGSGIYRLCVPTGGGKTLASFRYALNAALKFKKKHIFYIAPFKTILDQNAKDLRDILRQNDAILEHHGDVVDDSETHRLLTERWDSPIVLTTAAQFLDTLFLGRKGSVRRMHTLADSVIIIDEVQSIPVRCIHMFNAAVNFLAYICRSSVILCSATQPRLTAVRIPLLLREPCDMTPNLEKTFAAFRRTVPVNRQIPGGYTSDTLAEFVLRQMTGHTSTLIVMNTKSAAAMLFQALSEGERCLPDEERFSIYYLSTGLCPAHRLKLIEKIREGLLDKKRLVCVSTQLIEAGVNLSFECAIRSLAGLDSIAQAAGRCNRHGEAPCREIYIINSAEENLSHLSDIRRGQEAASHVLDDYDRNPRQFGEDLLSLCAMDRYYDYYFHNIADDMGYPLSKRRTQFFTDVELFDLLSINTPARKSRKEKNVPMPPRPLHQAFETAGRLFQAIENGGEDILVPYDEGENLIIELSGDIPPDERMRILRRAQRYIVHIFDYERNWFEKEGALYALPYTGTYSISKEYYDDQMGVRMKKGEMEFLMMGEN